MQPAERSVTPGEAGRLVASEESHPMPVIALLGKLFDLIRSAGRGAPGAGRAPRLVPIPVRDRQPRRRR